MYVTIELKTTYILYLLGLGKRRLTYSEINYILKEGHSL